MRSSRLKPLPLGGFSWVGLVVRQRSGFPCGRGLSPDVELAAEAAPTQGQAKGSRLKPLPQGTAGGDLFPAVPERLQRLPRLDAAPAAAGDAVDVPDRDAGTGRFDILQLLRQRLAALARA